MSRYTETEIHDTAIAWRDLIMRNPTAKAYWKSKFKIARSNGETEARSLSKWIVERVTNDMRNDQVPS